MLNRPNQKEVIDFLQTYKSNNKQYIVTGDYEETPNKTVSITVQSDSIDEVHQEYMSAFEEVQESIYETESADPQVRDLCAEDYGEEWEEMDEDEREEAISDWVIEMYCDSNAIDERIELCYHDCHKVIQEIIDWDIEEDDWTENEQPEDGLIMLDEGAAMVVSEPQLKITEYTVDIWTPSGGGTPEVEVGVVLEYCVDVLIDGEVCSYALYTKDFELEGEGAKLDWEVCG